MPTKKKIVAEFPVLARRIERDWPYPPHQEAVWQIVCLAYDCGFGQGITHGIELSSKIMG